MPPPAQLIQRFSRFYPKPKIDPVGTGLPLNVGEMEDGRLTGPPVLVQITSLTEIGHSAFTLQNIRQTRIDRADLAGLGGDDAEDEGPVPRYPRSMLRLQLSDGFTTINAIEFRNLPDLILGETPLGYKLMLKNAFVRRGIVFLEPKYVILKGHQAEDLEAHQDRDLVRGLRSRMGLEDLPEPDEQPPDEVVEIAPVNATNPVLAPPPALTAPAPPRAPTQTPPNPEPRSPLRELTRSPSPTLIPSHHGDEPGSRRRRIPSQPNNASASTSTSTAVQSSYFGSTSNAASSSSVARAVNQLSITRALSQTRTISLYSIGDTDDDISHPPRGSAASTRSGPKPLIRSDGSTVYEFGDDPMNEEIFLFMDQIEKEYQSQSQSASAANTQVQPSNALSASHAHRLPPAISGDVITIEDDEEDDKENVPVLTRRVRRRIEYIDTDVVDISD
ncbi:hypothetical protein HETIRDRAFT_126445 [Heterobasidion irregulare TC 32-1]|uniref:RecQ-mediated genome instability protein 1 n=1 Tax=Heterobasidion irregulare (strain TC 32-1) TaxID=747525 RepID=W4KDI1_HETIT|nr:uncharacterized protein HETIRDRAFT_126445 [Heterobasidion irregulare TC 32-1]ETW83146.1 hypothetical protein HETIRDRAFT_126445 [Heterobasidion irregulare TC 32-1]